MLKFIPKEKVAENRVEEARHQRRQQTYQKRTHSASKTSPSAAMRTEISPIRKLKGASSKLEFIINDEVLDIQAAKVEKREQEYLTEFNMMAARHGIMYAKK